MYSEIEFGHFLMDGSRLKPGVRNDFWLLAPALTQVPFLTVYEYQCGRLTGLR